MAEENAASELKSPALTFFRYVVGPAESIPIGERERLDTAKDSIRVALLERGHDVPVEHKKPNVVPQRGCVPAQMQRTELLEEKKRGFLFDGVFGILIDCADGLSVHKGGIIGGLYL
jgi:hypothetical protein